MYAYLQTHEAIALLRPGETLTWEVLHGVEVWCGEAPAQGAGRLRPLGARYVPADAAVLDSARWARCERAAPETLAALAEEQYRTVEDLMERAFYDLDRLPCDVPR